MCHDESLHDVVNLHARVVLAVPDSAPVLLLALELEDDGFGFAVMLGNGAFDNRARRRRSSSHLPVVDHCQYAVEFHLRTYIARHGLQLHRLARGYAILLAAVFNHCIHTNSLSLANWFVAWPAHTLPVAGQEARTFSVLQAADYRWLGGSPACLQEPDASN